MLDSSAINMNDISLFLSLKNSYMKEARRNKSWAQDLSLLDSIKCLICLSPAMYGPRIEQKLSKELNLKRTNDPDRGDVKSVDGNHFEIKASVFDLVKNKIDIVQIRIWQDCDYIIILIDNSNFDDIKYQLYFLSKSDMEEELVLCKATSAHGTKKSNLNNSNKELRFSIKINGKHHKRWIEKYNVSLDFFNQLFNTRK
jgi:hypothetical protein